MNWRTTARTATVVLPLLIGPAAYSGSCQTVRGSEQNAQGVPSERVKAIISRCLARGHSIAYTSDGRPVTAITWVPPWPEDYREMASIGPDAIKPLSRLLDGDKNGFVQLLAVKFLVGIGGASVLDPLERATNKDQWQVVRFAAMEELAVSPNAAEATAIIKALQTDEDPFIATHAREIMSRLSESSPK